MDLHHPMGAVSPAHLEFPSYATWVCTGDGAHVELLTEETWSQINLAYLRGKLSDHSLRSHGERKRPPSHVGGRSGTRGWIGAVCELF
jgi:hypothetical protein